MSNSVPNDQTETRVTREDVDRWREEDTKKTMIADLFVIVPYFIGLIVLLLNLKPTSGLQFILACVPMAIVITFSYLLCHCQFRHDPSRKRFWDVVRSDSTIDGTIAMMAIEPARFWRRRLFGSSDR